jgi:hypothetical protein
VPYVGGIREASDDSLLAPRDLGKGSVAHFREPLGLPQGEEVTPQKSACSWACASAFFVLWDFNGRGISLGFLETSAVGRSKQRVNGTSFRFDRFVLGSYERTDHEKA